MVKQLKMHTVYSYHCPICESKQILFRCKRRGYWCRKCGNEFRLNVIKKPKGG